MNPLKLKRSIARIGIPAFILIAVFLQGCTTDTTTQDSSGEKPGVSTALVREISHEAEIRLSGTVFANREANLGAGFPGKVEKLYYPEGTRVQEGQLLAELSGEMLAKAKAEYLTLEKDYNRVKRLAERGTVSRQEYDHLKARYEASEAQYELALKNTRIKAPFAGTIVDYLVNEGENYFLNLNLEPGYSRTSGILRLMQLNPVKVEAEINERDLGRIHEGLKATISIPAYPERSFEGKITSIKPFLSTRSRTATAEITINNPDLIIKPGMSAHVSMSLPAEKVLIIPMEAIYRDPETDQEKLYLVENHRAQLSGFNRLFPIGDQIAITGLQAGQEIITGGKNRVEEGMEVNIINNGGHQ